VGGASAFSRASSGRLQALEIGDGLGRLGGSSEDGAAVVLQQLQPIRKILRVVSADILRNAEFAAQEGRTDFRDEFLGGVGGIAEALAEIAGKAVSRRSPVGFMPISA